MKKVLIILLITMFFGSAIFGLFFKVIGSCDLADTFYVVFILSIIVFFFVIFILMVREIFVDI